VSQITHSDQCCTPLVNFVKPAYMNMHDLLLAVVDDRSRLRCVSSSQEELDSLLTNLTLLLDKINEVLVAMRAPERAINDVGMATMMLRHALELSDEEMVPLQRVLRDGKRDPLPAALHSTL
jgi:hypothetical protein